MYFSALKNKSEFFLILRSMLLAKLRDDKLLAFYQELFIDDATYFFCMYNITTGGSHTFCIYMYIPYSLYCITVSTRVRYHYWGITHILYIHVYTLQFILYLCIYTCKISLLGGGGGGGHTHSVYTIQIILDLCIYTSHVRYHYWEITHILYIPYSLYWIFVSTHHM